MAAGLVVTLSIEGRASAGATQEPLTDTRSKGGLGDDMFRPPNTNASGKPFDEAIIEAVWSRAPASSDHPPLKVDAYGALIWREGYGNTNSKFGWEIGYKRSLARGGGDDLENLQPLQWENNRRNGHS